MVRQCRARLAAFVALGFSTIVPYFVASTVMQRDSVITNTFKASIEVALPISDSFVFNGSTSDIARQLYLRHAAGESIGKCVPNTIPSAINARLAPLNVSFDNLPGLLQRALLWDSGYVLSPGNDAVQIWTLGGRSMANLAISRVEYRTTGCAALNCKQPDDTMYTVNEACTGTQMLTAAKCMMDYFDSDTSTYLAIWSDGGDSAMVPSIRAVKHGWIDSLTNESYLVYAIHTMMADSEPAYGTCNEDGYGSLVVPCYPMQQTSADIVAVMSEPVATPWLTAWIKQYQLQSESTVQSGADSTGTGWSWWLLGPIVLVGAIACMCITFVVFKKRQRLQAFYMSRLSPAESECSRKSKPSGPLIAPRQQQNRTSMRRTEQETIGDFSRTLRLPNKDDSPINEQAPIMEETLPRSRRNTAPSHLRLQGSHVAIEFNAPPFHRGSVPVVSALSREAPSRSTSRATLQIPLPAGPSVSAQEALERRLHLSCSRPSSARELNATLRPSSSHLSGRPSSARSLRSSAVSLANRCSHDVWSDHSSDRYNGEHFYLPSLRESMSMSTMSNLMPSIRDSIQADRARIPAMRETFSRSSATDNVHGDLMTWAKDKIDMAIGIARAIYYLHTRQVIHRDIKAKNILLTKGLQPKLIDFGTSRVWEPNNMSAGIGTPYWTAPEVLESSNYTEKADIYSFGVLLAELDTCQVPFYNTVGSNGEKMKPFHVLKEVVDGNLRPSLTVGCPQRIRKAADDCFQRDPTLRPTAAELVRLLGG
ncbi:hypothetical protein CCR75_008494 [Bremia lactucae]|uniref:Protein kinase domain-containing protein n=1 Tax=Bremia lactucae TaxID=4779 RepID=A0A976FNW3_BRELC|nr:hypothetical protein CCR75_008494 [Bremia lactucae]